MSALPVAMPFSLARAACERRTLVSVALATLQHAALLAWIGAADFALPVATAKKPAPVLVSLAALGRGGAGAGGAPARGHQGNPTKVVAAPSPVPSPKVTARIPNEAPPAPAATPARKGRDVDAAPSATRRAGPREGTADGRASPGIAGSGRQGLGSGDGGTATVGSSYRAGLVAWLARQKRYPSRARALGLEGEVVVRIAIDRSGRVRSRSLEGGSRFALLAREAEAMVDRADPFPAMPEALRGDSYEFSVPIEFRLSEGRRSG